MMTGLFDPARHEPLQALPWDETAAREAIRQLADSALAAYEPGLGWRAHPRDDPEPPIDHFHNLYFGAGGVVWALRHLWQGGAIQAPPDFTPLVATLREANRPLLADSQHGSASYLFGDSGLDLLHWTLQPAPALAQRLFDTVQGNLHNPAREALWGNPGTVLAAIHMAEATGETAHLSHRVGEKLVTLAFAYAPTHATRVMMEDADVLPWHATSWGHAVLAFLSTEDRAPLLARPLTQVTPHTETDPSRLNDQIAQVVQQGFAETAGTFERDVKSIAVPLFGPGMQVVGALGIVAPTSRITPDLHQTMLRETIRAADDIIALWGGEVSAPLRQTWAHAMLSPSKERPAP